MVLMGSDFVESTVLLDEKARTRWKDGEMGKNVLWCDRLRPALAFVGSIPYRNISIGNIPRLPNQGEVLLVTTKQGR